MGNLGELVPYAASLKDVVMAVTRIEEMLEGERSDTGESPSEQLRKWLTEEKAQ